MWRMHRAPSVAFAAALSLSSAAAAAQWAPTPSDPRGDGPVTTLTVPVGVSTPAARAVGADRPDRRVAWRWQPVQTWEYVMAGGFAGATLGSLFIPVGQGRWTGVNGFDDQVGSALLPDDREGRRAAADASDVLLALEINHMLFDALVVGWAMHGQGGVAYQMSAVNMETMAVSVGLTNLVKSIAARERPYGRQCASDPVLRRSGDCEGRERYLSFFSGHSSAAFTVAGLTCMHHAHLPLYGGGARDGLACVSSLAAASAVGVLRVSAEDHYPSDVLAGAALGTAVGLGVPWLLHYRLPASRRTTGSDADREPNEVSIRFLPAPTGGALVGEF